MKKKKKKVLLMSLVGMLFLVVWIFLGNRNIQTTTYELSSPKLQKSMSGYTIVQVSDLHNEDFGDSQKKLISRIQKIKPNMITVTGDLIDLHDSSVEIAMKFIQEAVKIAPVYYVTGNHEAWSSEYDNLKEQLINAGVMIMDGQTVQVSFHQGKVNLIGIQDPSFNWGDGYLDNRTIVDSKISEMSVPEDTYTILLSHRPELFSVYVKKQIDLVLAGHAHGGQFRVPFIGGLYAPDQGALPKYTAGLYEEGNTKMIVSRGLGNSVFPFRINNRPELVVVKFR